MTLLQLMLVSAISREHSPCFRPGFTSGHRAKTKCCDPCLKTQSRRTKGPTTDRSLFTQLFSMLSGESH
jgi:hypothetical protein